jgi:hypothetical protein
MSTDQTRELRRLEGAEVSLALADGSRLDDAVLVSAGNKTLWVFTNGEDAFISVDQVVDAWTPRPLRPAA